MARKTKAEALATRHHILDVALELFSRDGVSATSLADIAAAAGVTRGAIYWHFKNKVDVLHQIWLSVDAGVTEAERNSLIKYPDDPLSLLRAMLIYILQATAQDPRRRALMEIIFHKCEFMGEMAALREMQQDLLAECYEKTTSVLCDCIKRQQLPAELNIHRATLLLRSYINGIMESWLFTPECFDLTAEAPQIVEVFIEMLTMSPTLRNASSRG